MIPQLLSLDNFPLLQKADKGMGTPFQAKEDSFMGLLFNTLKSGGNEKNSSLLSGGQQQAREVLQEIKEGLEPILDSLNISGRVLRQFSEADVMTPQFSLALQEVMNQANFPADSLDRALYQEIMDFNTMMIGDGGKRELTPQQLKDLTLLTEKFSAHQAKDDSEANNYHHLERSLLFGALLQQAEKQEQPAELLIQDLLAESEEPDQWLDFLSRELSKVDEELQKALQLVEKLQQHYQQQKQPVPEVLDKLQQSLRNISHLMEEAHASAGPNATEQEQLQAVIQALLSDEARQQMESLQQLFSESRSAEQQSLLQVLQQLHQDPRTAQTAQDLTRSIVAIGQQTQVLTGGRSGTHGNPHTQQRITSASPRTLEHLLERLNSQGSSASKAEKDPQALLKAQNDENSRNNARHNEMARALQDKAQEGKQGEALSAMQQALRDGAMGLDPKPQVAGREILQVNNPYASETGGSNLSGQGQNAQSFGGQQSFFGGQPQGGQTGQAQQMSGEQFAQRANLNQVIEQIVSRVNVSQRGSIKTITVSLKPEVLGKVHIRLSLENSQLVGRMMVENDALRQRMESNMGSMREAMNNMGLRLERFEIVQPPQSGSHTADQNGQFQENLNQARSENGQGQGNGSPTPHRGEAPPGADNPENEEDASLLAVTNDNLDVTI